MSNASHEAAEVFRCDIPLAYEIAGLAKATAYETVIDEVLAAARKFETPNDPVSGLQFAPGVDAVRLAWQIYQIVNREQLHPRYGISPLTGIASREQSEETENQFLKHMSEVLESIPWQKGALKKEEDEAKWNDLLSRKKASDNAAYTALQADKDKEFLDEVYRGAGELDVSGPAGSDISATATPCRVKWKTPLGERWLFCAVPIVGGAEWTLISQRKLAAVFANESEAREAVYDFGKVSRLPDGPPIFEPIQEI